MIRPRHLETFRPWSHEMPWDLLLGADVDRETLEEVVALELVRVAKLDGRIVAAYGIRPQTPTCYELVSLVVEHAWRGRDFGRWLMGHALGLAESRGGREVVVRGHHHADFLQRFGFAPSGSDLRLELTPE
ncbi:MAG: GNAT family N-acetyltransferase [Pseudomonadales bacterium]|jgi:N-acetylglutamate synthase-like GNAT family acetyltransferase